MCSETVLRTVWLFVLCDLMTRDPRAVTALKSPDLRQICPGVDYILDHEQVSPIVTESKRLLCLFHDKLTESQSVMYGMCQVLTPYCYMHIQLPENVTLRVHVQRLGYWCDDSHFWETKIYKKWPRHSYSVRCNVYSQKEIYFDIENRDIYIVHTGAPRLSFNISVIGNHGFFTVDSSPSSGYILLPKRCLNKCDPTYNIKRELMAHSGSSIMLSFLQFSNTPCVKVTPLDANKTLSTTMRVCKRTLTVVPTHHLQLHVDLQAECKCKNIVKIIYSFHNESRLPQQLAPGVFNCSVDHYPDFEHHVHCNLMRECEEGQDETEHCPFSSHDCPGMLASHNKCFQYLRLPVQLHWQSANDECRKNDGILASIKTREEHTHFLPILKDATRDALLVGYTSGWISVLFMYSKLRKWSDNTLIYNIDHITSSIPYHVSRIPFVRRLTSMRFAADEGLGTITSQHIVCEIQSKLTNPQRVRPKLGFGTKPFSKPYSPFQQVIFCLRFEVTHKFMACDEHGPCKKDAHLRFCEFTENTGTGEKTLYSIRKFVCDDDLTTVPYTLVCNFRIDCSDKSDESFCHHPSCNGFLCHDNQCVADFLRCDGFSDCLDDSDERDCPERRWYIREADKRRRLFIELDGTGYFDQALMNDDDPCPDTHFYCAADWKYCLPVYTRCNGFNDCTHGEDEQDCHAMECPYFYRCRDSRVCVHFDHLCDGWSQCPQHDDEWLCSRNCPEQCWCQGHSFRCHQSFTTNRPFEIRYMDATGSGMTVSDFTNTTYLVYLNLTSCALKDLGNSHNLLNLQTLDLSSNLLKVTDVTGFLQMPNLRLLVFANNPLTSFIASSVSYNTSSLKKMDLSRTHLKTFNSDIFVDLQKLTHLNLSFSAIENIGSTGFKHIPHLIEIDIRGNPVSTFPVDLFSNLNKLTVIFSSNFRLCCKSLHPKKSSPVKCLSPRSAFFSCENLLPNDLHRLVFWFISTFAILGNCVCFLIPFWQTNIFREGVVELCSHLHVCNTFMGIHTMIVTVANEMYRGNYIHAEQTWTSSLSCKVATFLSLLSSQVSVLILWFLTLDHILVLRFLSTVFTFNKRSKAMACAAVWTTGAVVSLLPFIPDLSHWGLGAQSGLCRLSSADRLDLNESFHWFTILLILNCTVCTMTAAGQIIILMHAPSTYQIITDSTKRFVYSSGCLIVKLAGADVMRWLLYSLFSKAFIGHDNVSKAIQVSMFVILLPLTSALSPAIYMWTIVSQRRQKTSEDRMFQLLKSRQLLSHKARE